MLVDRFPPISGRRLKPGFRKVKGTGGTRNLNLLDNAAIAELLIREAETTSGHRKQAFRRAARAAFTWPEEAALVASAGRSLTELEAIGPWIARGLHGWFAAARAQHHNGWNRCVRTIGNLTTRVKNHGVSSCVNVSLFGVPAAACLASRDKHPGGCPLGLELVLCYGKERNFGCVIRG
jgi:hypothetical protein